MQLEVFESEGTEVVVSYLPAWEMFFSMHVLANPEHHIYRKKWVGETEENNPELVRKIRKWSKQTWEWTFLIDGPIWSEIRQMEIPEVIAFCRKKNIYQWNEMLSFMKQKMELSEREEILLVIKEYYEQIFQREELFLRPYLTRIIKMEKEKCKKYGIWKWSGTIHERLKVEEKKLKYIKNHEFIYGKDEIKKVFLTVSTFVEPHLWLYEHQGELEMVKGVKMEQTSEFLVPEQLVMRMKALGDESRIKIIKLLFDGGRTTQELAKALGMSEAGISKHLKLLSRAGVVKKQQKGHFVVYQLDTDAIDFIPYSLYEILTR